MIYEGFERDYKYGSVPVLVPVSRNLRSRIESYLFLDIQIIGPAWSIPKRTNLYPS